MQLGVAHKHIIFFNTIEEATTLMAASKSRDAKITKINNGRLLIDHTNSHLDQVIFN